MSQQQIDSKSEGIRELIRKGKIKEALDHLDQFVRAINDNQIEKDFLLLSAQYHSEEKLLNLNLSSAKERGNNIIYALIILLGEAKEAAMKNLTTAPGYKHIKKKPTLTGYCIRTGKEIPFNLTAPLSGGAFSIWRQFEDVYYPEKYCHFSGEPSYGDTCFLSPILKKNWKKAREVHGF